MGRYIGPTNKIARRFGINLGLKSNSNKVARRLNQPPGQHGVSKRRGGSTFSKQLNEKQKAKIIYGVRERQFSKYVSEAGRRAGDSGQNLRQILEERLDNVVYRLGFALTRAQARQFVSHGMFTLNGKKMNIPSHLVKVGDVIELKENKQKKGVFADIEDRLSSAVLPSWLTVNAKKKSGTVVSHPLDADYDKVFDVKLIIEYYSSR